MIVALLVMSGCEATRGKAKPPTLTDIDQKVKRFLPTDCRLLCVVLSDLDSDNSPELIAFASRPETFGLYSTTAVVGFLFKETRDGLRMRTKDVPISEHVDDDWTMRIVDILRDGNKEIVVEGTSGNSCSSMVLDHEFKVMFDCISRGGIRIDWAEPNQPRRIIVRDRDWDRDDYSWQDITYSWNGTRFVEINRAIVPPPETLDE